MALTAQIQPVQVLNEQVTTLNAYVINYDGTNCSLYWWLTSEDGDKHYDGNFDVPSEILLSWGIDDSIILQSLADANGFILI